jgi:thiol-disulfide isomerase/thioredoxin
MCLVLPISGENPMLNRRHLLGALTLSAAISLDSIASAMERKPYDQAAFDAAQAAGQPILVEVSAPWCPTCKAQAPILSRLSNEPRFKELVRFNVDFDSQKDLLKKFNVQMQSTLIVYRGKQETGRSTGDTNAASIEALLAKSI